MRKGFALVSASKRWLQPCPIIFATLRHLYERRYVIPCCVIRGWRIGKYFAENPCRKIYVMIAEVSYHCGRSMIEQMFLALKPGGRLRIATPDLQKVLALYDAQPDSLEAQYIEWSQSRSGCASAKTRAAFAINNLMSRRFIYDEATLTDALEAAGFADIRRAAVGQSGDSVLKGLEQHGAEVGHDFNLLETMVIEARKPHLRLQSRTP
jgi:hypothetical protein